MFEATKDAGRNTIFSAVSIVITYFVNSILPQDMPVEVKGAVLTLVLAGGVYVITFVDSWIHRNTTTPIVKDLPGILPF